LPYSRPTLTTLRSQAQQDINSSGLPGVDGFLQKAVLRVMAWVQVGFAFLHYGYLDWIALQSVPWSATDEYAAGWGALIGATQKSANKANGSGTFSGAVGTPIPAGTSIGRADQVQYVSTAAVSIGGGGTVAVPMVAVVAGADGNTPAGTTLTLTTPITGVSSAGVAAAAFTGGADQEDPATYKTRYLQKYADPPQGGAKSDYITWALEVPGVTRAWVNPLGLGAGSVLLYTMFDGSEAAYSGFPQGTSGVATNETRVAGTATGDLLAVADYVFPLQPVTALLYSQAPTPAPVAFTVADLGTNNTTVMQAAIAAALAAMFLQFGNVGGTVDPATGAVWPAIEPSTWYAALEAIPGLTKFKVTVPAGPITPATGSLFTVGVVTPVT